MDDNRNDAQLVTAYLAGDRNALAAIYDRYADALHDTAAAMLRDRHDAADATQDVFVVAAERLHQLRDRDRLKPWLFAVLRNDVFRRTKRRGRSRATDFTAIGAVEMAASPDPAAEGATVALEQLAGELRDAAAGLDERDRLVLELSARQGLAGPDLADALGVSVDQSYVLVHRMRERVERSLGALAVARAGRRDCADLNRMLEGWDGRYGVLVRKRVARHIERCDLCAQTKRRFAAVPLIALAPAITAPPSLRDAILASSTAQRHESDRFDAFATDTGFPAAPSPPRPARLVPALVAAAVLLPIVAAGVLLVTSAGPAPDAEMALPIAPGDQSVDTVASLGPTTTPGLAAPTVVASTATEPTTSPAPSPSTSAPTAITQPPVIVTVPPTAPQTPPRFPDTTVPDTTIPDTTIPDTTGPGTTGPGTTSAPEPRGPGALIVATSPDVDPPNVQITRARPTVSCPWSAPIVIGASVADPSTIGSVTLSWSGPGASGSTPMSRSGGEWNGVLDLDQVDGTWSYAVAAVDAAGNRGTASGSTVVAGC